MSTTTTAPSKDLGPESMGHPSTAAAFWALMLRDFYVLRKNLKEFIPRTVLQPLLLVFVFTYVFPKIGQGIGGASGAAAFSTMLVAGVIASVILFQGIQAVALPMVQEFGYTKEIEDRVLAPLPLELVAVAEDRVGRPAVPDRGDHRLPDRQVRAGDAGPPALQLDRADHLRAARLRHLGRARPDLRHLLRPQDGSAALRDRRHPAHVPRVHLLPVGIASSRSAGSRSWCSSTRSCTCARAFAPR